MSAGDLTPLELRAMKTHSVIFDRDDFKLVKLEGGWMYDALVTDGKTTQRLLPDPKAYGPYSTFQKKAAMKK